MGPVERFVAVSLRQRALRPALPRRARRHRRRRPIATLPVEAFPDLTNNQVVVVTEATGLAAPEVEQRVTYPDRDGADGRARRRAGALDLEVRPVDRHGGLRRRGAGLLRAAARHRAARRGARPASRPGSSRRSGRSRRRSARSTSTWSRATRVDAMERKTLHDWDVRTRLRSVPGVSEVNSWGGLTEQFQVIVDPHAARAVRPGAAPGLRRASPRNNASFSGGFIEHRAERYTVRGVGPGRRRTPTSTRIVVDGGRRRAGARVATSPTVAVGADAAPGRRDAGRPGEAVGRHGDHAQGRERPGRRRSASRRASTRSRERCRRA